MIVKSSLFARMCITFVWINDQCRPGDIENWQLILINNRDEFYSRLTLAAEWRDGVMCSRDMEPGKEGGTWLGMNAQGNIAFLQNINFPLPENTDDLKGRGDLVRNYLQKSNIGEISAAEYATEIDKQCQLYNGFALALIERSNIPGMNNNIENAPWHLIHFSNREDKGITHLPPGFHAFGNSPLKKPFKKVQKAKKMFKEVCDRWREYKNVDHFVQDLLQILKDKEECFPDPLMTQYQPHLSPPLVQRMTSCFVEFPRPINYGTRTHTVIMVNGAGLVTYLEQNLNDYVTNKWSIRTVNFQV